MKQYFQIIVIFCIICLTLYLRNKNQQVFAPPTPSLSQKKELVHNLPAKEVKIPSLPKMHPKAPEQESVPQNPYRFPPEGNRVEFDILDGTAIAYGDVMLGRVEEGANLQHGAYDAPNPLIWEKPEIPYQISPDLPQPERVEAALHYLRQNTPLQFVPYQNHQDAIVFVPGNEHCYSFLGRVGGLQPITLSDKCQTQEILHEILHALGFIHEHSRPDRDDYIDILWSHIQPRYQSQFAVVPESFFEIQKQTPFDYQSIMLYKPTSFSISPELPSIQAKGTHHLNPILQGISSGDISKILKLYRY